MADFVEASRAIRQADVGASQTMIERTEACFGIKPEWLAADTAYGSAANLDWLVNQQGIAPHVRVIDKSQREDGTFSREDFIYDAMRDGRLRLPSALSPQKSEAEKRINGPPPQPSLPAVRHAIVELIIRRRLNVARIAEGGSVRKRSVNKCATVVLIQRITVTSLLFRGDSGAGITAQPFSKKCAQ